MKLNELAALKGAEEQQLLDTMLVDLADNLWRVQYNYKALRKLMEGIAESLEFKAMKFVPDFIDATTPFNKRKAAITSIRLSKVPGTMIIVATELIDVTSWVKTYTDKDIPTYVYHVDTDRFYTDVEYNDWFASEHILDKIMMQCTSADRAYLEDVAETFGAAFGWKFSGPIRDLSITSDYFDKFNPYEKISYAGWKGNYSFANPVHKLGDSFIEDDVAPGSKVTITPSLKTRNMVGKPAPNKELEAFRDYVEALVKAGLLEDSLEDGWAMCECGHPVRKWGETHDDAYCMYCDRPIDNFEATIFDDNAYERYWMKCNLDQWENVEWDDDTDEYVVVVDLDDIKKYKLTAADIKRIADENPGHFRFDNTRK